MKLKTLGIVAGFLLMSVATTHAEDWQPTKQDEESVVALANDYFALVDRGDHVGAHALLAPSTKAVAGPAQYEAFRNNNDARYGAVTKRRFTDVWWYPKGSREGTGVAAALDFVGQTEKGATICGYLAIIEMTDGKYLLLRDNTTFLEAGYRENWQPAQLFQFLNVPGCRQLLRKN